jgi:hypothetical protein
VLAQLTEMLECLLGNLVVAQLSEPDQNHQMVVCSAEPSQGYHHSLKKPVGLSGLGLMPGQKLEIVQQIEHRVLRKGMLGQMRQLQMKA